MLRIRSLIMLGILLGYPGCANWDIADGDIALSSLPPIKLSSDSVAWQVVSLSVGRETTPKLDAIWSEVDESHLPVEQVDRLRANGVRCGLVGLQLPPEMRSILEEQDELTISEDGAPSFHLADMPQRHRLHLRAGQRKEIAVGGPHEKVNLLYFESDALVGKPLFQAQCMLAIESTPLDDGRVRISLVPEIQHGYPRSHFIGKSGAFQQQVRQDTWSVENLAVEATLAPGETLVLSHSKEPKGVGAVFFCDDSGSEQRQNLMFFRLVQTQQDTLSWESQTPSSRFGD